MTIFSLMSVGWGQDCVDGVEVELWSECYDIEETTELDLSSHQELDGEIPISICQLINLTNLRLHDNQLSGDIPSCIGDLINLTYLRLNDNQLSGDIPSEIGDLIYLTQLYLDDNQLSGEIPPEIGNLTNLTHLRLNVNELTGEIPSEIGNLTLLNDLSLHSNLLYGLIPDQICDQGDNSPNIFLNHLCPPYPDCGEGPITSESNQDTSECFYECSETNGDINNDNILDILDIVSTVNCILSDSCEECSDMNGDEIIDILDIVLMVNVIMDI
jgi:Leucine-rich repeat (LRR) protein